MLCSTARCILTNLAPICCRSNDHLAFRPITERHSSLAQSEGRDFLSTNEKRGFAPAPRETMLAAGCDSASLEANESRNDQIMNTNDDIMMLLSLTHWCISDVLEYVSYIYPIIHIGLKGKFSWFIITITLMKLRILLKQNTALLSTVRVCVCHRRDISHFSHI